MSKVAVHWFRHGQRLHDNPALLSALEGSREFYPVFIWDSFSGGLKDAGYNRARFIHQSLQDLDTSLRKVGGRLYVFVGKPEDVFPQLIKEWGVTVVTVEHDLEPIWGSRDDKVRAVCEAANVKWEEHVSLTLYDEKIIMSETKGRTPSVFEVFKNVLETVGQPERPRPAASFVNVTLPVLSNFDEKFALPSLQDLGYERPEYAVETNNYVGGESRALNSLESRMVLEEKNMRSNPGCDVPFTQASPDLVNAPLSLSPYLRMGCLSVRNFYWSLRDVYQKVHAREAPFELTEHLLWRDFFYIMSVNVPNYDKMVGNPLCMQIDWYHDDDKLDKWTKGQTGFPWIDACMRQLRQEGWIHHVCRHAVTCFLTRGDLWLHWEDGLKVFEHSLLDADWSVCAGNWMWVSSSAFENCLQCPQCYSPYLYGARLDPNGEYVRRYVPEVRELPLKYLFTPWKAPLEIQQRANCRIGVDYPEPVVNHVTAWNQCKQKMEEIKGHYKNINVEDYCIPSNKEEVWSASFINALQTLNRCSGDLSCDNIVAKSL